MDQLSRGHVGLDGVEEANELRWRCMHWPMTRPSSTFSAANSVVVPCGMRHRARASRLHRLGAERLDLALLEPTGQRRAPADRHKGRRCPALRRDSLNCRTRSEARPDALYRADLMPTVLAIAGPSNPPRGDAFFRPQRCPHAEFPPPVQYLDGGSADCSSHRFAIPRAFPF